MEKAQEMRRRFHDLEMLHTPAVIEMTWRPL
jgi:hypothetical protein